MKATDSRLPAATGRMPSNGADWYENIFTASMILVNTVVKEKWRNDKKTTKWNPSTSVMYLLHITTPTTDKMLDTTPTTMINALDMILLLLLLLL